jgi:magnesium-transporting ATPase (P-type)
MERRRAMFDALPDEAPGRMGREALFESFQTSKDGLADAEARRRLERFGPNEIGARRVTARQVAARQFRSPMVYLLAAAAAVSFAFRHLADGATIAVILLVNAAIGFCQEYRSERAVEKLREKLSARARVRREGGIRTVERATWCCSSPATSSTPTCASSAATASPSTNPRSRAKPPRRRSPRRPIS